MWQYVEGVFTKQEIVGDGDPEWWKNSIHGLWECSDLYDYLIEEGHNIDLSAEIKEACWKLAKQRFNKDRKFWIDRSEDKEWLKNELNKVYKSFLIRAHFVTNFYQKDLKISLK